MARKNQYGKFILSAGEIGSYTVCPEAWRLQTVCKVKSIRDRTVEEGSEKHAEWSEHFSRAMYLTHGTKLVVVLILTLVVFFLLSVVR